MRARTARHAAAVLAVTIASGLLFSVSSLNERKTRRDLEPGDPRAHPPTPRLSTLDNEVSSLDAQVQSFSSTPQSGAPTKTPSPPDPPAP